MWVNWVSIGSANGYPPVWRQAIIWNKADLLSIGLTNKRMWNLVHNMNSFTEENAFENVVGKMSHNFV